MPILSLIVIGTEEFWVKPLERADAARVARRREEIAVPSAAAAAVEDQPEIDEVRPVS